MFTSKNKIFLSILFVIVLIAGTFLFLKEKYTGNPNDYFGSKEGEIKQAIIDAGYCNVSTDCEVLYAECPFGCHAPVNKKEADKIRMMLDSYESTCIYSCIQIQGVECVENKCQIIQ